MSVILKHSPSKRYRNSATKDRPYRFAKGPRAAFTLRYERRHLKIRLFAQKYLFIGAILTAAAFLIDGSIVGWQIL